MEGGGPDPVPAAPPKWPGVVMALVLTAACYFIAGLSHLLDPILLGMLLGMAVGNFLPLPGVLEGSSFVVKKVLPFGIVLLGARLNFFQVLEVGASAILMSLGVVALGLLLVFGLRKFWGLERTFALLLAVGTSICGGTAIVAVAPLVHAQERDIILGVGVVTVVGLVAMLLLPPMAGMMHMSEQQFGVLAGLTIHQTPQVVAAGFSYGDVAGQTATVVKLARVCLLAPIALTLGWWAARNTETTPSRVTRTSKAKRKPWYKWLPTFALGFLAMALVRTLGIFPEIRLSWESLAFLGGSSFEMDTVAALKHSSSFLLAMGMVGVGFQTRFSQFKGVGMRPLVVAAICSLVIALLVLLAVKLFIPA